MEETVFNSSFRRITFEIATGLMVNHWHEVSEEANDAALREDFALSLEKGIAPFKPSLILHDLRQFRYTIPPETQVWIDENINAAAVRLGVKKVAFIVPHDIFTRVSVEQVMEEGGIGLVQVAYFDTMEDALNWLRN